MLAMTATVRTATTKGPHLPAVSAGQIQLLRQVHPGDFHREDD
jgi:hypothetical protein